MRTPEGFEWLFLLLFSLVPALLPTMIAYARKTTNRTAVLLVALLTSWTCVGWVIALVMAVRGEPEDSSD